MNNHTKSSVISRLNNNWEAQISISLPLGTLDKLAKKATKQGFRPTDYMKSVLEAAAKEGK